MNRRLLLAALVLGLLPAAAPAKPKKDRSVVVTVKTYRIPQTDARVVADYYRGRSLPPGLQKKLQRQGRLPPGWEKRIQPVPVAVEERLAPVPEGCRRGMLDGAFVVYEPGRGVIIDVVASFGR
jgi:hypothetical protein